MKDRESGKVAAQVVEQTDKATSPDFVVEHFQHGATVRIYKASAYSGLAVDHEAVRHSVGVFVRDMAGKRLKYADLVADYGLPNLARPQE